MIAPRSSYLTETHARGWVVFPMRRMVDIGYGNGLQCTCAKGPECPSVGKHPAVLWADLKEPMPLAKLQQYSCIPTSDGPACGFGLHVGRSGIVALDIDKKHDGYAKLAKLIEEHGDLPPTYTVATGGGGRHYYFKAPDWIDSENGFGGADFKMTALQLDESGMGVELFAGTHILITPHSPHASGNLYEIIDGGELAELPAWIVSFVMKEIETQKNAASQSHPPRHHHHHHHHHHQDAVLNRASLYIDKAEPAISGKRGSKATSRVACILVIGFDLSTDEAFPLLRSWNDAHASPPWDDDELSRKLEWADAQPGPRGDLRNAPPPAGRLDKIAQEIAHVSDATAMASFGTRAESIPVGAGGDDLPVAGNADGNSVPSVPRCNSNAASYLAGLEFAPHSGAQTDPDAILDTDSEERCPFAFAIEQKRGLTEGRGFYVACKRWKCSFCAPRKKADQIARVCEHMAEYGGNLCRFTVAENDIDTAMSACGGKWSYRPIREKDKFDKRGNLKISADELTTWENGGDKTETLANALGVRWIENNQIHSAPLTDGKIVKGKLVKSVRVKQTRIGASYSGIVQRKSGDPDGLVVYATFIPGSSKITNPETMTNAEGIARFRAEASACQIPSPAEGKRGKIMRTSTDWPLTPPPGEDTGWRKVKTGRDKPTIEMIEKVAAYYKAEVRNSLHRSGRYGCYPMVTWKAKDELIRDEIFKEIDLAAQAGDFIPGEYTWGDTTTADSYRSAVGDPTSEAFWDDFFPTPSTA